MKGKRGKSLKCAFCSFRVYPQLRDIFSPDKQSAYRGWYADTEMLVEHFREVHSDLLKEECQNDDDDTE